MITSPPRTLSGEYRLAVLRAEFECVRAEIRAEWNQEDPGYRHRVARLLRRAVHLNGQIQAAEGR